MGEEAVNSMESTPVFILATICLPLPLILIGIFCTYQGVVNAMRALSEKPIHIRSAFRSSNDRIKGQSSGQMTVHRGETS